MITSITMIVVSVVGVIVLLHSQASGIRVPAFLNSSGVVSVVAAMMCRTIDVNWGPTMSTSVLLSPTAVVALIAENCACWYIGPVGRTRVDTPFGSTPISE